jgi:dienelactone hydrolase
MDRLAITIVLAIGAALGLTLPSASYSSSRAQNNSQNRPPKRQPPLPPRTSTGAGASETPREPNGCPGVRECTAEENKIPPQVQVEFPGPNNMTLHGHLYVPGVSTLAQLANVTQKFPAMIYNHGSESTPSGVPHLAKLYVDHGFILFCPDRHGQGLSKDAGPYHVDEQDKFKNSPLFGQMDVALHELYNQDVIAAVAWFKKQPYVDTSHIGMTGISFGGIQTLLTAEKDPGIRAYVAFAPAADSWHVAALRERLVTAVRNEKAPLFIIQAEGDYDMGPVTTLGVELLKKGNIEKWKPKRYPKFGCTHQQAHGRFSSICDGIAIWDQDVLAFLNNWVK